MTTIDKTKLVTIKINHIGELKEGQIKVGLNKTHHGHRVTITMPLAAWLDLEEKLKDIDFNG